MKAADLMIGDWVRLRYTDFLTRQEVVKEFQVGQLRYLSWDGRGDTMYVGTDHQNMSTIDKMEPIPITSEILKKNGFTQTQYYSENLICDWQIQSDCEHLCARNERGWHLDIQCKYVHELQHALRLCGIEKEIEL